MNRKILKTVLTVGAIVTGIGVTTPAQANDNYCRDFNQKIKINDQWEQAYGRACLQPNGTWEIVSSSSGHRDDRQTTNYVIHKTYTHTAPFRIGLYWGDGYHYHGRSYRHKNHKYHHHGHAYHHHKKPGRRHGHRKHH